MSKVVLKLYDNGDLETIDLKLNENSNLFVLDSAQLGTLNTLGEFDPTPSLGSMVSDFINVTGGSPYTFQLYWDTSIIKDSDYVTYSIQGYDEALNHVLSISQNAVTFYGAEDIFSGTIPEGVSNIRVGMNRLETGAARIQILEGSTPKTYTLSTQDLIARGLPSYSISEESINLPKLIEYDPNSVNPAWVKPSNSPFSIFTQGLVIKGKLIQTSTTPLPALRNVVYLKDDYVATVINDQLKLSEDGGLNFTKSLTIGDEVGTLKYIHVFSDGSVMFCTDNKVYNSADFMTYSESSLLDIDGSPLTLTGVDNFAAYNHDRNRQILDGVEMLVWGNYTHTTAPIRVWYTTDKGLTVKSMYRFNLDDTNATTHVHNVVFNSADKSFWILTGDYFPPETKPLAHFMKCMYDASNDSWTFETVGSSLPFKSTNMVFIDDYAYWTWDTTNGGIVRSKYSEIADVSKHERLFQTTNDCLDLIVSDSGEFIVTQSYYGGGDDARNIWYSPDRVTFHKILTNPNVDWSTQTCYYGLRGPNRDGKVIAGVANANLSDVTSWNLTPTVFLDEMVREAGFESAFKTL